MLSRLCLLSLLTTEYPTTLSELSLSQSLLQRHLAYHAPVMQQADIYGLNP